MFLFESIPWYSVVMWLVVLFALMLANELTRRSKYMAIFFFIIVPVILGIFVWPKTAGEGTSVGSWFHWAKLYSVLAGCIGFMIFRYNKKLQKNKCLLAFPAVILIINIAEAVIRDFESFNFNGVVDGMFILGGPWNIMNGIAGILNVLAISGFFGIMVSRDKNKDMVWPDQLWFWIIAYDIWNFAYVYNCVGDHAFYAGLALLLSCTLPALFIKKGIWLQNRAHTLAFWMMFVMSVPSFVDTSTFAVKSSHNPIGLFIVSALSLIINLAVFVYHFYKVIKYKKNPLKDEIHSDLESYKKIANECNHLNK